MTPKEHWTIMGLILLMGVSVGLATYAGLKAFGY